MSLFTRIKLSTMQLIPQIAAIQKGEVVPGFSLGLEMVPKMKFAPDVSVEVERFFSLFRLLLAPQGESYTVEN